MKHIKLTALIATALASVCLLIFISGCGGGSKSHDIESPYNGINYGMETEPADSETNINTDTWIHIFWPDSNFPPPAEFTVRVEELDSSDEWNAINTELDEESSEPDNGSWWFEPVGGLSVNTWYRVIVTDELNNTEIISFRTNNFLSSPQSGTRSAISVPGTYKPKNINPLSKGPIAEEHRIHR